MSYLAASLALMGLLSRVHTLMDSKSRSLDKLFPAAGVIAHVRTNTAVNALCKIVSIFATRQKSDGTYRDEPDHFSVQKPWHTWSMHNS